MPTISTKDYLLDQAKQAIHDIALPNAARAWVRSRSGCWTVTGQQHAWAEPPAGSELKPVMGDSGLPILGHMIEMFRGGPDFCAAPVPHARSGVVARFADPSDGGGAGSRRDPGPLLQPQQGLLAAGLGPGRSGRSSTAD